jgi:molecular chaperone GrpE
MTNEERADRLQADDRVADGTTAAPEEQRVESDIDALLADTVRERDDYLDLAKRTQADFENYRKRIAKESAAAESRGRAQLAGELLTVADNLERALEAADDGNELVTGVRLVYDELIAALKRAGVESYVPEGERFDPELHEAMLTQPVERQRDGEVVKVMEKGYRLGDQILRPARVVVGKAEEVA